MADTGLIASSALVGFNKIYTGATLRVVPEVELLALALPSHARQKHASQIGPLPNPGQSNTMATGQQLIWVGIGQYYTYREGGTGGEAAMNTRLEDSGYVTDISDGWIGLELTGSDAQARLDLITLPDLSDEHFAVGAVTSTVIAHLRVLIWRRATDQFVLLSAASSARSLFHSLNEELPLHDTVLERTQ